MPKDASFAYGLQIKHASEWKCLCLCLLSLSSFGQGAVVEVPAPGAVSREDSVEREEGTQGKGKQVTGKRNQMKNRKAKAKQRKARERRSARAAGGGQRHMTTLKSET